MSTESIEKTKKATGKKVDAFTDDILGKHDAVGLAELIRKKELGREEVAQATIARVRSVMEDLNPIEVPAFEAGIEQSKRPSEYPGAVFEGIPSFIKDNTDLKGFGTSNGCRAYTPVPVDESDQYTKQHLAQGFTILGKSKMPEFGFNASTEFEWEDPTRNPWNTDYSAGGSSGGSAAMVASGAVTISHANDGGGSIRIPAYCCGLVGLKPTRDRHLNNHAAQILPINIVSEGVVTRSVRDTAMFSYGLEREYANPKLKPIGKIEGPSNNKYRIALVLDSITGYETEQQVKDAVTNVANQMEKLGHTVEVVDFDIPKFFMKDFTLYWALLGFLLSTFGKWILGSDFDGNKVDTFTKGLRDKFHIRFLETPVALLRLRLTEFIYNSRVKPYDAILTPVMGHAVPKLGYLNPAQNIDELLEKLFRYVMFTPLNNVTGSPAISLPLAQCSNGLPLGVHFMGGHGEEAKLIDIAYQLEAEMGFKSITD